MKIQTYPYNTTYLPAAPFAELIVHNNDEAVAPVRIAAQIDTGADATMLPASVLEKVGARFESTRIAYDFSGQRHMADLYAVSVSFAGQTFFLQVVSQENTSEGIVGRDILNDFVVTLNGLANVTEIPVT